MVFKSKKILEKKYKYKDLKIYASTEWLADGKKKYRKVFESLETTYLYAELSFYNKLFDEGEEWDVKVNLKCFKLFGEKKESVCDLHLEQHISSEDNIVFVREGWGNESLATYWKRGTYVWEAYIDEELVGSQTFYVENNGLVSPSFNPYFDISHIKLFEGSYDGAPVDKRKYLKSFNANETRYIWVELAFENDVEDDWYCELIFNFYNDSGQLKGQTTELKLISATEDDVVVSTGWGSDNKGTWFNDKYKVEVIFMDQLIAVIPFECGDKFVEGNVQALIGEAAELRTLDDYIDDSPNETLEDIIKRLDSLVGLEGVKRKVKDYVDYLEFLKIRKEKGFEDDQKFNLHSLFKGNPGTGKTTVAKLVAKIYHKMGFLTRGHITEVGRAELIGQYIGQTAPKVKEVIESARGGVLFIDEAYGLARTENDDKDYGHEAIEVLVKEMSDGPGNIAIFLAGYPKEMEVLLKSNPGLKSRVKMGYEFNDYTPKELMEISNMACKQKAVVMTKDAKSLLYRKLTELYRNRDKSFGNARLVLDLIEDAKMNLGLRLIRSKKADLESERKLQTIRLVDMESSFRQEQKRRVQIDIDYTLLKESLAEINKLKGLGNVKTEINELVDLVTFYVESGKSVLGNFSLHTIFKGNPGTGKTTVARLLSKIYKALGIIERGHLIECDRQGLVAGFIGQTAAKTKSMVDKALGGVLFIDEAYALSDKRYGGDYGQEAIEALLKEMEDNRGDFIVIVAGYPDPMDRFLESNPGFKSRFDHSLNFEDFSEEELLEIATSMLQNENLTLNKEAEGHLKKYLTFIFRQRDKFFGNGRTVRKVINTVVRKQHLRMAGIGKEKRTMKALSSVILADVSHLTPDKDIFEESKKKIGFSIY